MGPLSATVMCLLCPVPYHPALFRLRATRVALACSRPSDPAVSLVSTANLAALGGYKDQQEALKR